MVSLKIVDKSPRGISRVNRDWGLNTLKPGQCLQVRISPKEDPKKVKSRLSTAVGYANKNFAKKGYTFKAVHKPRSVEVFYTDAIAALRIGRKSRKA